MEDTLLVVHQWAGYVVFLVLLLVILYGNAERKSGHEFKPAPYSVATVLLDLQVTLGIVMYAVGSYWDSGLGAIRLYVHPAVMLAGLGIAHVGLSRARREQMADDAYRRASGGLFLAAVVVAVGIGLVSAA